MRKKEAMYNERLKCYRDVKNSLDAARRKGREKGLEESRNEGRQEVEKKNY